MRSFAPLAFAIFALSACNAPAPQAAAPAPASQTVTAADASLPAGAGCADEIARYRAIQDNDLAMGHVARSVYDQIKGEIAAAEGVCAAGHDAEARRLVVASKTRHGYPVGL